MANTGKKIDYFGNIHNEFAQRPSKNLTTRFIIELRHNMVLVNNFRYVIIN